MTRASWRGGGAGITRVSAADTPLLNYTRHDLRYLDQPRHSDTATWLLLITGLASVSRPGPPRHGTATPELRKVCYCAEEQRL